MNINEALEYYTTDTRNPEYNFQLALSYDACGQTASAASFYLRTAEFGRDPLLSYEALLRLALCFERQGSRVFMLKGILLRAISYLPERPEAYYLLSWIYEKNKDWQECYTWAILGERLKDAGPLRTNVNYPGRYGFTFERAVSAWWIGLYDESVNLFKQLRKYPQLRPEHRTSVERNLSVIWNTWRDPIAYERDMYDRLRYKFQGASNIEKNYSQCFQDLFVLMMTNGKKYGKYLEIGCGDPFYGNNTALLEKDFGWTGISIDIDKDIVNRFNNYRRNKAICADALKLNYKEILKDRVYDYLQVDCEPSLTSFEVLKQIPLEERRFRVITFEHDHYVDDNGVREKSRKYIKSFGYRLLVNDIALDDYYTYEDWYVDSGLVDNDLIRLMTSVKEGVNNAEDYIFI